METTGTVSYMQFCRQQTSIGWTNKHVQLTCSVLGCS